VESLDDGRRAAHHGTRPAGAGVGGVGARGRRESPDGDEGEKGGYDAAHPLPTDGIAKGSRRRREQLEALERTAGTALVSGDDMLPELVSRFLVGGGVVSAFSAVGEVLQPKTFSGLAAAPSVAIASLTVGFAGQGSSYLAAEVFTMVIGAVGLLVSARAGAGGLGTTRLPARVSTTAAWFVWLVAAFGIWAVARVAVAPR
jgi:hypothetical protein